MNRFCLTVAILLWVGCENPASPVGEKESADVVAERIITLTPAMTETVFALGLGESVIAADASSTFPREAEDLATLPYFRQLAIEPLLALKPTLILSGEGAGPEPVLGQLKMAGVRVEVVPDADSFESALLRVESIAQLTGADPGPVLERMQKDISKANTASMTPVRVTFVYARGAKVLMAAGPDTAAGKLIALAGAEVVPKDFEGFKPLTAESLIAASPDLIVMADSGVESIGGKEAVFQIPGISESPAGKAQRLVLINDQMMVFGPRSGVAVLELKEKFAAAMNSGALNP